VDRLGRASVKRAIVTIGIIRRGAVGIATVPILATVNPTPCANIGIEIKIMATSAAVEAHTTTPQQRLHYVSSITLATKRAVQFGLLREISRPNGAVIKDLRAFRPSSSGGRRAGPHEPIGRRMPVHGFGRT
jgi:hypothetical protein